MTRIRSPNYPSLSLPEALDRIKIIFGKEQHLAAPKDVVAKHLGFSGLNGGSTRVISSLLKYGLLDEVSGDKVRVSSLARSILHPTKESERVSALKDAALRPALFQDISAEWQGGEPSDINLRSYLLNKNFAVDALDRVIQSYRDTIELVTSAAANYNSEELEDKSPPMTDIENLPMKPVPGIGQPPQPTQSAIQLPSGEPYKLWITPGHLQGTFDITDSETAEAVVNAINAWKILVIKVSS